MTAWDVSAIASDLAVYLAIATVVGVTLLWGLAGRVEIPESATWRRRWLWLLGIAAAAGVASTSLAFLVEVGAINQRGVAGMFDYQLGAIMADTALGDGSRLRLLGFALVLLTAATLLLPERLLTASRLRLAILLACTVAGLLLAGSFTVFGHVANLDALAAAAIMLHVITMAAWLGSLFPLWWLARCEQGAAIKPLMRVFGAAGWCLIGGLLLSGIYLLWQLVGTFQALFGSAYGQSLLTKLLLVVVLMSLGAWNKFRLVPQLGTEAGVLRLRRSIAAEMLLALMILLLTASFTSLTGPP